MQELPVDREAELNFSPRSGMVQVVVGLILVIGALRFGLFITAYQQDPTLVIDPDTLSYQHLSESIFERGKYERVAGIAEAHRPPLYPAYLAMNYAVFGKSNLLAPVLLQHIMTLLIASMMTYLAYRLGGPVATLLTPLLYLTEFTSFYYANEILSETLFTFLLSVSVTAFAIGVQKNSVNHWWILAAGLTLTAAVFVRPVGLLLSYPAAVLLGAVVYWQSRSAKSGVKTGLIFLTPWLILGGAWYARNFGLSGEIFFTNYEGHALFKRLSPIIMAANHIDSMEASYYLARLRAEGLRPIEIYFKVMFSYPLVFASETFTDILRVLLSPGQWHLSFYFPVAFSDPFPMEQLILSGDFRHLITEAKMRPPLYLGLITLVFCQLLLLYAGLIASIFSIRLKKRDQVIIYLFLILFCFYFVAITFGFIGHSRFRVPFVPFLSVLAAAGLEFLLTNTSNARASFKS
ncbi:MAG: glycosyltransferase family 39 protein [Rhodospirillales bacterium]|nr:glycosyltransferase family 39 protein [Rhodospirillales bacterium]